jgi:hypothetical protein
MPNYIFHMPYLQVQTAFYELFPFVISAAKARVLSIGKNVLNFAFYRAWTFGEYSTQPLLAAASPPTACNALPPSSPAQLESWRLHAGPKW